MKMLASVAVLTMSMLVQGCSLAILGEAIEPTDLSALKPGTPRQAVESVLGKPVSNDPGRAANIALYGYDKGAPVSPVKSGGEYWKCWGAFNIFCESVLTPLALIKRQEIYESQRGQVGIHYAADDTAVDIVIGEDFPGEPFWEALSRAVCDDPDAQFQIGDALESGRGVRANDVEAFKWYTISASRDNRMAAGVKDRLMKKMSKDDVMTAEALAAKWLPNLEGCEAKTAPAN